MPRVDVRRPISGGPSQVSGDRDSLALDFQVDPVLAHLVARAGQTWTHGRGELSAAATAVIKTSSDFPQVAHRALWVIDQSIRSLVPAILRVVPGQRRPDALPGLAARLAGLPIVASLAGGSDSESGRTPARVHVSERAIVEAIAVAEEARSDRIARIVVPPLATATAGGAAIGELVARGDLQGLAEVVACVTAVDRWRWSAESMAAIFRHEPESWRRLVGVHHGGLVKMIVDACGLPAEIGGEPAGATS